MVESGRVHAVIVRRADGSSFSLSAGHCVVVAAGATETPPLLRRSGLGGHPMSGRNLALHPAVSVAGRFEEPVLASRGVLQSASVEEFHARCGILVEATSAPAGMGSMLLPGFGAELLGEMRRSDHLATLGAMIADSPNGRVVGKRRPFVYYRLSRRDGARLVQAIGIMARLLLAAGAREIITGIPQHMRIHDEAELCNAISDADPQELHLAAFHPVGTCAAGSDENRYPVDRNGALRGVEGVWVADASVLPSCPTVNPQVTIMAFALAIADRIVERTGS